MLWGVTEVSMTLAVAKPTTENDGPRRADAPTFATTIKFTLDASYPDGGYPLTDDFKQLLPGKDLSTILAIIPQSGWGGYTPVWDRANSKLMVFRTGAINLPMEQVPGAVDLQAVSAAEAIVLSH
jgi:hypothetical protein